MRTIQSELTEKGFVKADKENHQPRKKKAKETLSDKDLQELMGCNRSTYARGKGGAYKQR